MQRLKAASIRWPGSGITIMIRSPLIAAALGMLAVK